LQNCAITFTNNSVALQHSRPPPNRVAIFASSFGHAWSPSVTPSKAIAFQLSGRLYGHEGIIDTAIRLRGEFHDIGFAEDNIRVHSGPSALDNVMTTGTFLPQTEIWGILRVYAPLGKNFPIAWCSIAVMLRWVLGGEIVPLNQHMFLGCLNVHRHVC